MYLAELLHGPFRVSRCTDLNTATEDAASARARNIGSARRLRLAQRARAALRASGRLAGLWQAGSGIFTPRGQCPPPHGTQKRCRREGVKLEGSVIRNRACELRFADPEPRGQRGRGFHVQKRRGAAPRSALQPSVLSFLFILIRRYICLTTSRERLNQPLPPKQTAFLIPVGNRAAQSTSHRGPQGAFTREQVLQTMHL